MMYQLYQAQLDILDPLRFAARNAAAFTNFMLPRPFDFGMRSLGASLEFFGQGGTTHKRPAFGIGTVFAGNREVAVTEEVREKTPFGDLLHFRKDTGQPGPVVLVVAPLSGHFATLLRHTVEVMLQDHDVYITDWHNARDIPRSLGHFGFDEYITHIIDFLSILGPNSHVVAVCQPTVAVLAAVSLMSEMNNPATPCSMTLMAGPIDTRQNPTAVNLLAKQHDRAWFEKTLTTKVPSRYKGAGRRVYPGFMQLASFMSMNLERHIGANLRQFRALMTDDAGSALLHRKFYDEYFAVMDLTAEFYLETVQKIFQDHELPQGLLQWQGQVIDPSKIQNTALLTIEGERDDICATGQTSAALGLCSGLTPKQKQAYIQPGVGHYGVFSGSRWENEIYPIIRALIKKNQAAFGLIENTH
jgi:poly(3-hydroxybutyrate) depolymerase